MTDDERIASGVSEDLVRLSVGTENVEDIIDDLRQSLCSSTLTKAPITSKSLNGVMVQVHSIDP